MDSPEGDKINPHFKEGIISIGHDNQHPLLNGSQRTSSYWIGKSWGQSLLLCLCQSLLLSHNPSSTNGISISINIFLVVQLVQKVYGDIFRKSNTCRSCPSSSMQSQVTHRPLSSIKVPSRHRHSCTLGLLQPSAAPSGFSQVLGQGVLTGDSNVWPSGHSETYSVSNICLQMTSFVFWKQTLAANSSIELLMRCHDIPSLPPMKRNVCAPLKIHFWKRNAVEISAHVSVLLMCLTYQ